MAELGSAALVLALVASLYAAFAFASGKNNGTGDVGGWAGAGLYLALGLVSLAVLVLLIALLTHQFQLEYIASYTSSDMAFPYLVSALWAGNAGSLLFWAWLLTIFAVLLHRQRERIGSELAAYAASFTALATSFFILLMLTVASPFGKLGIAPPDGAGLNPLLENPGMILHPPTLLAGYACLTIPFALAIGALVSGKLGEGWLTHARRWALLAWLFLGVGNIIGAWWAYVELGWGGYWAWDPVENAGLMPWLAVTAFLHSIMIQKRKRLLKYWSMALIILAFNLAIFGTFITRSGILSSVHTFGNTGLEPFFLVFLNLTFWGSWLLLYRRRHLLADEGTVDSIFSREGTFQLGNILMLGATVVIFIGTVFPGIASAVTGTKIEVGEAFFNQVMGPVFLSILLLVGVCSIIGWQQKGAGGYVLRSLLWPGISATMLTVALLIVGVREGYALAAFFLCSLSLLLILLVWVRETKARRRARGDNYIKAFWTLARSSRVRYGAHIIHIALVLIAMGVTGSSLFSQEKEAFLLPGQSAIIGDYVLTYQGMTEEQTPSKTIVTARMDVSSDGAFLTRMEPQKLLHRSYEQPVTEVAIRTTAAEDLYVILSGWDADGTAVFRILVNPLVVWIWVGGALFALGGLLAFWPQREPLPEPAKKEPKGKAAAADDEIEKMILIRRKKGGFCPECGAAAKADDRFCAACGSKLG